MKRAAAERALKTALAQRSGPTGGQITGDTRFRVVAALWLAGIERAVTDGERSATTAELYARQLHNHVLSALGELRIREVTVSRTDAFLREVRLRSGAPTARTCRSVVSGVLGVAVRYDAVPTNAAREVSRIPAKATREPRALTDEERRALLARAERRPGDGGPGRAGPGDLVTRDRATYR